MADVEISYKGEQIASMNATGVKTLLTSAMFCEDDIVVEYTKPSAPSPTLQSKTVSPSTSQQTVSPDSGYDGLSSVTVNAMPSGSATTPATSITANPTISVSSSGLITASVSGSQSVTPSVSAGYVSSGTAGTVTVNGSNTQQLTVYNGEHHQPVPSGYTVTVSLTNPVNVTSSCHVEVKEQYSSTPYDTGTILEDITTVSGNTDVTVPASLYGISLTFYGPSPAYPDNVSVTDGLTVQFTEMGYLEIAVTASGTVTIDGMDYDD